MQLIEQVCSLELAKQLKELGIKQDSLFYWYWTNTYNEGYSIYPSLPFFPHNGWRETNKPDDDGYSAFTVAELLTKIPQRVTSPDLQEPYNSFRFRMEKGIWSKSDCCDTSKLKFAEYYRVNYFCDTTSLEMDWHYRPMMKNICDENPANALAKMVIYLIENKLT